MDFVSQKKNWKAFLWQLASVSLLLFLATFLVSGCSSKDDNEPTAVVTNDPPVTNPTTTNPPVTEPTTTQAAPVVTLISPETLKGMIDSGVVNGTGAGRVVILDVQSAATFSAGHIPGALQMDSGDLYKTRQEGPANDVSMVVDGAGMDALVQKFGIDGNTTIVITGGSGTPGAGSLLQMTRAYFTFRYWGFPKEKLKFLDGVNFAWTATYSTSAETGPQPAVTPSTYSVKSNAALQPGLRASLGEMIAAAEGATANALVVDMRSSMTATDSSYAGAPGKTAGVFAPGSDFTVFEGRIKGAKALNFVDMFDSANNFRFKSAEALTTMFEAIGITKAIYAHVH